MKIVLPWPPTNNTYWRHPDKGPLAGRHLISERGRKYRTEVQACVLEQRALKRIANLIIVDVLCFPPDRRKRDLGNLDKALFDSLTHAGVWLDDSQIDDQRFRRARDSDGGLILGGRVVVTIQQVPGEDSMKLKGARQAIHDAFAIHLTTPDGQGGGGKFDSTRWAASTTTAGFVIKATLDQKPHLRGVAIFMNAPDPTVTQNDINALKAKLWADFTVKLSPDPHDAGIMVAYIDRIILGYRSRVRNNKSDLYTAGAMFNDYSTKRCKTLTMLANQMIDILQRFDQVSLEPIYAVIEKEREQEGA